MDSLLSHILSLSFLSILGCSEVSGLFDVDTFVSAEEGS